MAAQSINHSQKTQVQKHKENVMLRIIAVVVLCLGMAASAAEYVFPGWNATDPAVFEAQLPNADSDMRKIVCTSMIELARTKPASFDAMRVVVEAAVDQYIPNASPKYKLWLVKLVAFNRGQTYPEPEYIRDAWAYCLANPGAGDAEFLSLTAERLGTTDAIRWEKMWDVLAAGLGASPPMTMKLLQQYVQFLPSSGLSAQDALAKLTVLNRVYTPKLIENKTAWEPIVAQIRTVMEAYK